MYLCIYIYIYIYVYLIKPIYYKAIYTLSRQRQGNGFACCLAIPRAFDANVNLSSHSPKATCLSILAKHGCSFEDSFCHWVTTRAALAVTLTFSRDGASRPLAILCSGSLAEEWSDPTKHGMQNLDIPMQTSKRRNMTRINQYQLVQDLYPSTIVHDHLVSSRFTLYHASEVFFAGKVLED